MKGHVCKVCGYISINGKAPDKCPVCHVGADQFLEKEDAITSIHDPSNPTEAEKKHTPAITVVKECGLIPGECTDVHVKVGEIQHPMADDHYIQHIDFYIDREFISRVKLLPAKLNPAAALHVKPGGGKLSVIESCTLHGQWLSEADL